MVWVNTLGGFFGVSGFVYLVVLGLGGFFLGKGWGGEGGWWCLLRE